MNTQQPSKRISGALYVGIDVAKDTLAVFAEGLFEGEIENNRKAIARMVRSIRTQTGKGVDVRFAVEETGAYSLPVHLELDRLHEKVCVLNPVRIRHYAKFRGVLAKTDRIDARMIARYADECFCEPKSIPSSAHLALRDLIRTRSLLVKIRTMIETLRQLPLVGPTSRKILSEVDRFIETRIDRLDQEMSERTKDDADVLRVSKELEKLRGVGSLTATTIAVLAPELGTLGRRQAAALAGLAPIPRESGQFKGLRKIGGGREELRRALFMAALSATRWDPTIKAFYHHLKDEKKKKHMVALVACMRKMFVHMDRVVARLNETGSETAS